MNVNFHSCIHDWCYQKGTKGQYTRCKTVSNDGRTCYNPEIRYGSTIGGIPGSFNEGYMKEWCKQLFPTSSIIRGSATSRPRVTYLFVLLLKMS